jgi:hypothetical protein
MAVPLAYSRRMQTATTWLPWPPPPSSASAVCNCFCCRPPPLYLLPIWPTYDFKDISYWVAFIFTLGCVAWVINGHYALWPLGAAAPSKAAAAAVSAIAAAVGGGCPLGGWRLRLNMPKIPPRSTWQHSTAEHLVGG